MQCPNCGQTYRQGDQYCGSCGNKLNGSLSQSTQSTTESFNSEIQSTSHSTAVKQEQINGEQNHSEYDRGEFTHRYMSYEHRYAEGPFTIKVKSTFNESKQFFKQAFTSHDAVMKGNKLFSMTLLSSLVIIGLLILGMFLHLLSARLFDGYFVDTATIILKFVLTTMLALAFLFIVTFAVIRLMIVESISFKKVLSDYILVNTLSVSMLFLGFIVFFLELYIFSGILIAFSVILLLTSSVYLISKYSVNHTLRFASFYSVMIFFVIIGFALHLFGSTIIHRYDDLGILHQLFWRWL
ncbi:zinc ribbon domain-containing protein [Staphylococcus haemolyticus]|uniref:zinc ribbon domain-containing protein n=1 Tax=Staphylococcus haemolyticus TaxID=1283 RepID=UPI0015D71A93|nr:zinc ribbon domain-containing protein [Staphylococcus haemolyticus]